MRGETGTGKQLITHTIFRRSAGIALLAALTCARVARAQASAAREQPHAVPALQEQSQQNVPVPCVQPTPMVRWEDYQGPFSKVVGLFGRKLERKSVHAPHYKPAAVLCTLELKDKFILFVQDPFAAVTFLN